MGLEKKLNLFILYNFAVGIAVAAALIFSWQSISQALERVEYANQLESRAFVLQKYILTEEISAIDKTTHWIANHKKLSALLENSPGLKAPQKTLQNSLDSKNQSLLILYRQLQRLSATQEESDIQTLLKSRLLSQVESILEDSQALAALSRDDIKSTLQRQMITIILVLGFGLVVLLFDANRLAKLIKNAINILHKGIKGVNQGHFESIEPIAGADEFSEFINQFNHMSEQLKKTTVSRDVLQQIVDERTAVLKEIASTDPLTQVANRRALFERGEMEFNRARRHDTDLVALMLDCDWFKSINDTFGHPVGDNLLISLCRLCEKQIREEDLVGRYGGEEFVILLPHCDKEAALKKAHAIRKAVTQLSLYKDEQKIEFTISIGVARLESIHDSFEQLISDADSALLKAKENGRNCVEIM